MKSSRLVASITRTVIATGLSLFATMASAYTVVNITGVSAFFAGQFCPACMRLTIPAGASRSCPADKIGCRGDTWIYGYQGKSDERSPYCYAAPTQRIKDTDTIVFSKDGWQIFNNSGVLYASGQYEYWLARSKWDGPINNCPGYFQEG